MNNSFTGTFTGTCCTLLILLLETTNSSAGPKQVRD